MEVKEEMLEQDMALIEKQKKISKRVFIYAVISLAFAFMGFHTMDIMDGWYFFNLVSFVFMILSRVQLKKYKTEFGNPVGRAKTAKILSIIALVITIITVVVFLFFVIIGLILVFNFQ